MSNILLWFSPTPDQKDRFFSTAPTSLLYASSVLLNNIDAGTIKAAYHPELFHPVIFKWKETEDQLKNIIEANKITVFALSCTSDSYGVALRLAQVAKEATNGKIITILGGPHFDELYPYNRDFPLSKEVDPFQSRYAEFIDYAWAWDGEYVLDFLVKKLATNQFWYLDITSASDEISQIPWYARVISKNWSHKTLWSRIPLDELPFIRHDLSQWHHRDFTCFRDSVWNRLKSLWIMSHRWCPQACTFCSESWTYEHRSYESILEDIDRLIVSWFQAVFFDDSTFHHYKNIPELVTWMHKRWILWGWLTRFDHLQDINHVRFLSENWCTYLYCAIEQFDNTVLKKVQKWFWTAVIERGIDNLKECNIELGVSLLFGVPWESRESIDNTLDFVEEMVRQWKISYVSMSLFAYHPNIKITRKENKLWDLHYNITTTPNQWYPWNCFEEWQQHHASFVTSEYAEYIIKEAYARLPNVLVRNLDKDWKRSI